MADPIQVSMPDGPWPFGIDSVTDPINCAKGTYVYATNCLNKGGIIQTRPGFGIRHDSTNSAEPRGLAGFYPKNQVPTLVKAIGTQIRKSSYPFTSWQQVTGITLVDDLAPVYITQCIKGAETQPDGSLKLIESFPILMIQDGLGKAWSWDGATAKQMDPDPNGLSQTLIGKFGIWAGNRYWVAQGPRLYAMNILEPDKATETNLLANGGYLTLPDNITGIGVTADEKSLLVFTATTTTSVAISVPRSQWGITPGFQTVILPNIGCVSHRSIINQYGMLWWMSQGGLVNLDEALSAFRSSRIRYKDNNMNRSKANMSGDRSNICSGYFENFMMVSVPSGDLYNAHTWIMDEMTNESDESTLVPSWASVWTGIRPVEWVTMDVYGQTRCFVLSSDIKNSSSATGNVWEAFIGIRQDQGVNAAGNPTSVDIPVSMETRYLSNDATFKTFDYAAALFSELEGEVLHSWSYASRHSGYLEVLDKTTASTVTSVDGRTDDVGATSQAFIRQRRELRSVTTKAGRADGDKGIENPYTRNMDRGFSMLIAWEGQAALDLLAVIGVTVDEQAEGRREPDEETDQTVRSDGVEEILDTAPATRTITTTMRQTAPVRAVSARVEEQSYSILL